MPEQRTPGLYVEETQALPPPIAPVETALPVFIGYTAKVSARDLGRTGRQLLRVDSLTDYVRLFGQPPLHDLAVTVIKRVDVAGRVLAVAVDWAAFDPVPRHFLAYALQLYFSNGGRACFVYSLGRYRRPRKADFLTAIAALEAVEGPTLLVMPDAALLDDKDHAEVLAAALAACTRRRDRFVIADVPRARPGRTATAAAVESNFRAALIDDAALRRYGAAYFPYLDSALPLRCSDRRTRVASFEVVTVAEDGRVSRAPHHQLWGSRLSSAFARQELAVYRAVKAFVGEACATLPPCGAVAGLYAKLDHARGLWKAPANEALAALRQPAVVVNDALNQALNVDPTGGKSVNAIRSFPDRGTLVWGARTLAGNDSQWRYVNVSRFAIFLEQSLRRGLRWALFEPGDATTWARLRLAVETFLIALWREGALKGNKPEEAFTVAAGLGTTMTEEDINQGHLIVQIGFAPLRRAEFMLLRIVLRPACDTE